MHVNDRWDVGGEEKDKTGVFCGTWNVAMQSEGQWTGQGHVWRELGPVLDISWCLKDSHWRGLVAPDCMWK